PPPSTDRLVDQGRMPDKPPMESLPGFPSRDSTRMLSQSAASKVPQPRMRVEETTPVMPALAVPLGAPVADSAHALLPSPPAPPQTATRLAQAIEALRLADDRFRAVRAEVRGDAVYLRGTVYRWEHLFELARSVSRLPGVRRVLFE